MNTKIKIATGMFAGLIAGTMLVGTAVAAPRLMTAPVFNGYGMMRSFETSGAFDAPTVAEMNSFMNRYLTTDGSIDVNRMHADVVTGKVVPPCLDGDSASENSSATQGAPTLTPGDSATMPGLSSNGSSTGYNMMGSTY